MTAGTRIFSRREWGIESVLFLCALISVVTTIGILLTLSQETYSFFQHVSFLDFLFGLKWEPLLEPQSFGVLPLVWGTMVIMVGSAFVCLPIGLLSAIYLSEYASQRAAGFLKPTLEILAGVPTVVYGYFALDFVTPILSKIFPQIEIFNGLSASIVVGIMIVPMVSSLCSDAFSSVPKGLREGGYAMGATTFEVIVSIVIPACSSRILAAIALALSRAIGETMAVTLAAGATPQIHLSPLVSLQTMTAYIVQVSLGDTQAGGVEYLTCYSVGALLFVMTFGLNMFARRLFRQRRPIAL